MLERDRRRISISRLVGCSIAVAMLLLAAPRPAPAQVSGIVDVRENQARALVRNTTAHPLRVSVALWESDEARDGVQLVRVAQANVWPNKFELTPGETQTVRITLAPDIYSAGTVLRLETRMIPFRPQSQQIDAGVNAGFVLATRVLSKVRVH
jgi:P pilus assembly chaperone PapD